MSITIGTNSWVTEAAANTYFTSRYGADDYWTDDAASNPAALITAYLWLQADANYTFATYTPTSTIPQNLKDAQCEYALFIIQHQPDIDLRMGLQAQFVVEAGVVKEKYAPDHLSLPIPPTVLNLLESYEATKPIYLIDIERDEEQLTGYDAVTDLDRNA